MVAIDAPVADFLLARSMSATYARSRGSPRGETMSPIRSYIAVAGLVLMSVFGTAHAVTSATFVFDTVSDPGDLADGPDYHVTGIGPIDDGGGCDLVVMVMVDPVGTPVDIDTFCLNLATGLGDSDGDYGAGPGGAVPAFSPVTYALFDLTAADIANTSGMGGDSDIAYFNYIVANARLLAEKTFAVDGLPSRSPFSFNRVPRSVPASTPAGLALLAGVVVAAAAWQRRRRARR